MKSGMKKRLAAGLTAGAMMLSLTGPAFAAPPVQVITGNNLVSILNNPNVTITDVRVVNVEDSLNNNRVLNNVDVDALQNFLNNNNVDVDISNLTIQGVSVQGTTLVIFV